AATASDADGDFVITWESADGSGRGIFAQRCRFDGVPQGAEFRVNTTTAADQSSPAVAMDADGDFIVVWQSVNQDGDGLGVYGQRFNAAGLPQDGEFRVNTGTVKDQSMPAVGIDADGNFTVVWQSNVQDYSDVYAQRFSAAGAR